ncbi:MAG: DUF3127 domain-containing protein [Bacteroidia bacterium]|nr:DUF3127 domain-containing protein [Bacteroidales bacterium]MDO5341155.1 DUF3127 domain-containing protein [Bacteroidia bacterium]
MELIGKVLQLGTLTEGSSPRGPWKKQELIIETMETYPKKICVLCWNERVNEANGFFVGQIVTIQISIESREFNGKWYTDVRAIRFDQQPAQPVAQQQPAMPQMQQQPMAQPQQNFGQAPLPPVNEAYFASSDNGDDLPF